VSVVEPSVPLSEFCCAKLSRCRDPLDRLVSLALQNSVLNASFPNASLSNASFQNIGTGHQHNPATEEFSLAKTP